MAVYYIDSYGSDTKLLVRGITQLIILAKSSKFRQAAIAVHTKNQVQNSIIFKEAIGKAAAKNLVNGKVIIEGYTVYLLTERIDPSGFIQGPILAAAISTKFLREVLKNRKATDIVYVPWTPEELEEFKRDNPNAVSF
jgi:hypothetical protein